MHDRTDFGVARSVIASRSKLMVDDTFSWFAAGSLVVGS
jgi:hypothetical protein